VLPSVTISEEHLHTIKEYTRRIAVEMGVCGLMNIQYAIAGGKVYILEANPRASRTVPLVSKVCNIRMVPIAVEIIMGVRQGKAFDWSSLQEKEVGYYGVKEAVFPFNMFPEVDPLLGPEMLSTGEVLGLAQTVGEAFYKAQEATGMLFPHSGTIFISVNDNDKQDLEDIARGFSDLGFSIIATKGTAAYLKSMGIESTKVNKLGEGYGDILTMINAGEIDMIINTPLGDQSAQDDSYIRKSAIKNKICYVTTTAAARAALKGIASTQEEIYTEPKSLQLYHAGK